VALAIVIPAHDEEAVIGACLRSLLAQRYDGPVHVVVVANGCRDATALVACGFTAAFRDRSIDLDVLELDVASKPAALNGLPYVADEVIGGGVYAIRGDARGRWRSFPDIGADDKLVRLHFADGERRVLTDSHVTVYLPAGVRELVRVRSRWIRFNRELRRRFPAIAANDKRRLGGLISFVWRNPGLWKDLPMFLTLYGCAEIAAVASAERARWTRADRARELRR